MSRSIDFELVTGDPDSDFFTQNPELQFFPFVKTLINKHGSTDASKIMWSLYLVEDPKSKIYHAIHVDERIDIVEKRYGINYGEDAAPYVYDYIKAAMGPHAANYKLINDHFQKMLHALSGKDIDESADFLSKLKNIYNGLEIAEDKYVKETETQKTKYKGDREPGGLFKKRT